MKDIEAIVRVQKRATKQIKQIRHLSYSERLKKLNLPTLRYRRHRGDMIEVYKILLRIYDSDICEDILKLSDNKNTRGHPLKLLAQQSRLDVRKYSFAVRVVTAPSVQAFEARLDKAWNVQPVKFLYREDLLL